MPMWTCYSNKQSWTNFSTIFISSKENDYHKLEFTILNKSAGHILSAERNAPVIIHLNFTHWLLSISINRLFNLLSPEQHWTETQSDSTHNWNEAHHSQTPVTNLLVDKIKVSSTNLSFFSDRVYCTATRI